MGSGANKVLLTSNGDEISQNIAFHLFKQGCRLRICFVLSFKFNSLEAKGNVTK
jgi:hypothetical protein